MGIVLITTLLSSHVSWAACRDPINQPFASSSIWNTPIGTEAQFVAANLYNEVNTSKFHVDTEYIVPKGEDVVRVIDQGWWGAEPKDVAAKCPNATKKNLFCHCTVVGPTTQTTVAVPRDFVVHTTGNNEGTIFLNKTHVLQLQPIYRCQPGAPILGLWKDAQRFDPRRVMSLWDDGAYGCHGGSGLSGFGGSIRRGELNASAPPIQHAIKIELYAFRWYWCGDKSNHSSCYRWPADTADGYALDCADGHCYNGSNPLLQPGSLLAVPAIAYSDIRPRLATEPARRILDALYGFGGYIVDDAYGYGEVGFTNICYEAGVDDEVMEEYSLELSAVEGTGNPLYDDLIQVFRGLSIVSNNNPDNVGGGGDPIVPPPPPLCPPPLD